MKLYGMVGMVCYIICYVKVWLYEVVWCGMVWYATYFAM